MVDLHDGYTVGVRMNIMQMVQSVCLVESPLSTMFNKTATGCCIECGGVLCLITSGHVVNSYQDAEKTICRFNADNQASSVENNTFKLSPNILFWNSPVDQLDCTIVALDLQNKIVHPFRVEKQPSSVGCYVHVWGHPNLPGKPLQQASGAICTVTRDLLTYRACTLDGFSGAPVISVESGLLIGIHCSGPSIIHKNNGNVGIVFSEILRRFHNSNQLMRKLTNVTVVLEHNNWSNHTNPFGVSMRTDVSSYPSSAAISGIERLLASTVMLSSRQKLKTEMIFV
jgi:hypothetical protein